MEGFINGVPDHLGNAAQAKRSAKQAIKEKRFDDAWRHLHEQQSEWLAHAKRSGMTKMQTLSMLSSIHEDMANVLRLEGKHEEALANILYCVSTNSNPTQAQKKKLVSYFRRCKFDKKYSDDQPEISSKLLKLTPGYRKARKQVLLWRSGEAPILTQKDIVDSGLDNRWVEVMGGHFKVSGTYDPVLVSRAERKIRKARSFDDRVFWARSFALTALIDWRDIRDAHGTPIPYRLDYVAAVLADEPKLVSGLIERLREGKQ